MFAAESAGERPDRRIAGTPRRGGMDYDRVRRPIAMFTRLLAGFVLMAVCVTIHAGGVAGALRQLRRRPRLGTGFWPVTRLFVRIAIWMVSLHLAEIAVWAAAYTWIGAMPDMPTALYFSAVTYTTTGYGDLVLPQQWRIDGGIEALTGILMCGWSTGFFFAFVNRFHERSVDDSFRLVAGDRDGD